jgi:hypothetical protein
MSRPRILTSLTLVLLSACGRNDVAHYRVPKVPEAAAAPTAAAPMAMPPGGAGALPPPSLPAGSARLGWTLPAGWTQESGGGGMRYATLRAPVSGKADCSVTVLPGDAGGELANVNRWRNQIGLPPIDGAALAAARKPVASGAGPVSLYDFTGGGKRLIAGLALVDGNSWFIKITGEAEPVSQARTGFLSVVESLRRESSN